MRQNFGWFYWLITLRPGDYAGIDGTGQIVQLVTDPKAAAVANPGSQLNVRYLGSGKIGQVKSTTLRKLTPLELLAVQAR